MKAPVMLAIGLIVGIVVGFGAGYVVAPSGTSGTVTVTTTQTGTATTTAMPSMSMGVVMWWHHDEGTWSPSHARAIEALQEKYNLEVTYIEETGIQDVESIIRTAAGQYDIVYVETDEFSEATKTVAQAFPDTYFIQEWEANRLNSTDFPNNVICLNAFNVGQLHFLLGAAAGLVTQTNQLGILLAIPGARLYRTVANPYKYGALHSNPDITVTSVEMNAYADPIKARDSMVSFAEAGIDVVFVNQDDWSATLEAAIQGMYTIQEYIDITPYYPDSMIGCAVWDWQIPLDQALEAISSGTFEEFRAQNWELMLNLEDGSLRIPTWGTVVTEEIQDYIAELRQDIIDGTVTVPDITTWEP